MEVEEIERQVCKIQRLGNGTRPDSDKVSRDEDDEGGRGGGALTRRAAQGGLGDGGAAAATSALRGWHHHHHSSRIIRVSRATGGKDRHSKVLTSRGLRDRRVRLSVTTAIQFYDLQDRLGYDQPSKAVEWLIKAAADAIAELPSLNTANIPETPRQLSNEKIISGGTELEVGTEQPDNFNQQNSQSRHFSLSQSACSSASDTSKNSGLSLARSDVRAGRAKARERARERKKEKDQDHQPNINHISHQNSSFTELLTCGIGNSTTHNGSVSAAAAPMDYFGGALFSAGASSRNPHSSSRFPGQIQLGTTSLAQTMSIPPPFSISRDSSSNNNNNHPELQHYSFVSDHLFPVAATTGSQPQQQNDYNSLNFSISPGFAGFNRGTLQSNSPSLLPHHLQRLSSPLDVPPFFISTAAAVDHHDHNHNQQHHQFSAGFDGRGLQLCYGDTNRGSDQKPKPRN